MLGLGLSIPDVALRRPYNPQAALGTSLLGWWDAARSDLITQSGGLVSSWRDAIAGYNCAQASGSLKPAYSVTGFNGGACLTFDGIDDRLSLESQPFPSGATGSEIWVLVDQTALSADTTARHAASYGGTTSATRRTNVRQVTSGVNRAQAQGGDGTANVTSNIVSTIDLSGRHVMRARFSGTQIFAAADGGDLTAAVSLVPGTGTTRVVIGASTAPGNYWHGAIAAVLVTTALSAAQAAALAAWLKARGGIA